MMESPLGPVLHAQTCYRTIQYPGVIAAALKISPSLGSNFPQIWEFVQKMCKKDFFTFYNSLSKN